MTALDEIVKEVRGRRLRLKQPRFHCTINVHPVLFINVILEEDSIFSNGILSRMFISAPMPPSIMAHEIRSVYDNTATIHALLFLINLIHKFPRIYSLSNDAKQLYDFEFNHINHLILKANQAGIDEFLM